MSLHSFSSTGNTSLYTARSSGIVTRGADEPHVESSMLSTAPSFISQSGVPTDEEFEVIRSNFGDPRANVRPEDYYAFRMIASGDGLDSYFTRQDVETSFNNFVRDLKKGQSVLGSHLNATFSYGSSFDGEVMPADDTRAEYEGTFYPQWDTPELRTRNWLVGRYFIPHGVTVNGQSSDDLIRSIQLGSVRKASISFMVGQYVCGLDGNDLISTMFGPMPDEMCSHFPGLAYEGQVAWALMKNNTLVETSLVYKNASPSSMLLRKAETLASRGVLNTKEIAQLEGRFQVRLPRFERTIWTTSSGADSVTTTVTGMEESDMAGRRRGANDATRELVREALTTEPVEDDSTETAETVEAVDQPDVSAESTPPETETTDDGDAADGDDAGDETAETPDAPEAAAEDADGEATEATPEPEVEAAAETETTEATPEATVSEAVSTEPDPTPEPEPEPEPVATTPVEDVVAEYVNASDRLASALARNADAFDSGALADAARAERAIDLALIDAGCDTTVGSHVARTFETRSRALREALGDQLTVEAIRSLQAKAQLGDTLYEELVKDAVAARSGVQGDGFNAAKYRDLLMAARDVAYVKEEIASWKEAKRDRFNPGRQVVPRQVTDVTTTRERRSLPEAPAALPAPRPRAGEADASSILAPRKK